MRVALVGVGLIGGSVGMAARSRLGAHVVGCNRSPAALEIALERGAIDEAVTSIDDIGSADVAIAGVAVDALPATVRALCRGAARCRRDGRRLDEGRARRRASTARASSAATRSPAPS